MGNTNKVHRKQDVERVLPEAKRRAAERLGKPIQYSELDLVNALYNYINGYNIDPVDKQQMFSQENLSWALDYLNSFGHNQKNLDNVVSLLYNAPRNTRIKKAEKRNSEKNKNNKEDGYSGLGRNLLNFTTGVIDIPRKTLASIIHHGTEDGRYDASNILNVMDPRATPVTGIEFARNNPMTSAVTDILAGIATTGLASLGANVTKNAVSYAGRKPLTGFLKTKALQNIQNNTIPEGTAYEAIRTVGPSSAKQSSTYRYEWGRQGGPKLTGTTNPATGRPYTKGSVVNGSKVKGLQVVNNEAKATDNVYAWGFMPWAPFAVPGIPQYIPGILPEGPVLQVMPHTIVEEAPSQYDDSDIINALGAQPGDIIYMPDGRVLRYIPGGTGSRGNEHHYTTVKEYDRHDSDVKQQHNVPDKTYTKKEKREGTKVYTRPGKNPSEHKRNPNDWYPRIVPITNGKNNR